MEAGGNPIILVHSYHLLYGENNRVSRQELAFDILKPYALKGARTVLKKGEKGVKRGKRGQVCL